MKREADPALVFVTRSGRPKAPKRAGVVVLEGAAAADLRSALAWAERFDARPLVVAVDGGLATCRASRRRPDLFVGDLDSARAEPRGVVSRIYPAAKDFSDFSGALAEVRARGVELVAIAGLLGGRLDHEWANLMEAGAAARWCTALIAPSVRGLVVVTSLGVRVLGAGSRQVSLFALGGEAQVSLRGARWTLARSRIPPGSLGLSNLAGDELSLVVHRGVAALVFPRVDAG